ncbi:hypothetical protein PPROV_000697900 [Pycnococcus provasolii]|uniref:Uncharacterized protein n=1 Tax=Pycnococcus provasolii TaxID=41880 RepID=A0A830HMX0_9CHLO|nr:hypothetical protein PPROV_000697900 [Pycnococcus provasolii]
MADDGEGKRRRGQRGPAKDYGGASRSQPKRGAADLTRERISDVHRMEEASHFDDEGNKERKKKVARLTGTSAERASRLQEALAEYNIDFQHLPSLQARSSPMSMSADQRRRVFSLFDKICGNGADEFLALWHSTRAERSGAELELQRGLREMLNGDGGCRAVVKGSVERAVLQSLAIGAVSSTTTLKGASTRLLTEHEGFSCAGV